MVKELALSKRSWLCVGLDPDLAALPDSVPPTPSGVVRFTRDIVEATTASVVAYKINFAFFEVLGPEGWRALAEVRDAVPPQIPVIADAKRGDIANTAKAYADAILGVMDFDAVTVAPYVGWDALEPFLSYAGKGVFVLAKTSNPGASDLQDLVVDGLPLYLRVVSEVLRVPARSDVGFVVGATQREALRRVRQCTDAMLLMPGVGAQGAGMRDTLEAGRNSAGENALGSVSRQILSASRGPDYAAAAAREAERLARESWEGAHAVRTA